MGVDVLGSHGCLLYPTCSASDPVVPSLSGTEAVVVEAAVVVPGRLRSVQHCRGTKAPRCQALPFPSQAKMNREMKTRREMSTKC